MIEVRDATLDDVQAIRDIFAATYGGDYAYPQYYNVEALNRLVYADDTIMIVAVDSETGRVEGTGSVVFDIGAYNDLVGEFGRLVVHPDARGKGIGKLIMQGRVDRVCERLHVGTVENRVAHAFSQRISNAFGFVPVGFLPMKLLLDRRESVALYVRHFGNALELRRNHPRIIPEASQLAGLALQNCQLPIDCIIDDATAPYPQDDDFEEDELQTAGYASLLQIERGRVRHREVFGPVRLHYGLFQLRARRSHYLLARRNGQVAGGIGFMLDQAEKAVRIFELISRTDMPIRFLLELLLKRCREQLEVEYVEIDVSAYAPQLQRTLLEFNFEPVGFVPANVFHEVERLDVLKMARLLVPFDVGQPQITEPLQPVADAVIRQFEYRNVLPRVAAAASQVPLFVGLNDEQRTRLIATCTSQTFEPGEKIFSQGDAGGAMHLILDGSVEVFGGSSAEPMSVLSVGQCLGETSLLYPAACRPVRSATAVAKTPVETACFSAEEFAGLLRRRADIGVVIYRNLATDVSTKLKLAAQQPP